MNKPNQLLLTQFFEEILERQVVLHRAKLNLQQCPGFDLGLLFKRISLLQPVISMQHLRKYLSERNCQLNQSQLYTLLFYFDSGRTFEITPLQLSRVLWANSVAPLSEHPAPLELSEEADRQFVELVRLYIERQRILEVCRQQLIWQEPWRLFHELTPLKLGYLTSLELYQFLEANGLTLCQQQLDFLMRGIRRPGIQRFTQEAFCQLVRPKECAYFDTFEEKIRSQSDHLVRNNNIAVESILLRERLDNESNLRAGNRSRRRILADAQQSIEREDFLRERIEKSVEEQLRNLRRKELQFEKDMRRAIGDSPSLTTRFPYPSNSSAIVNENSATARESRNPPRFLTPAIADDQPEKPNLIFNTRNSLGSASSRRPANHLRKVSLSTVQTKAPETIRHSNLAKQACATPSSKSGSKRVSQFTVK